MRSRVVPYSSRNKTLRQGEGAKASLTHKRNFQRLPHQRQAAIGCESGSRRVNPLAQQAWQLGDVAGDAELLSWLLATPAVSALAIPALAHAEQSGPQPAVPKPTKADAQKVVQIITSDKVAQNSAADADIDEDFSIITGLSGGPTSYLDGIKKMPWVLKLLDQCGLDEQHIRGSATSAIMRTKLGFVSSDEDLGDFEPHCSS